MDKKLVLFLALVACCVLATSAFDPLTMNSLGGTGTGRFNTLNGRNNVGRGRGLNNRLTGGRGTNGRGRPRNLQGRPRRGRGRISDWEAFDNLSLMMASG